MATNRLSGLISGMDTESLVSQLVSAYSVKKDKVVKNKTKLEWKQEKWKELNAKIYALYSKTVSNLQYTTAYASKKTTVSDETKVSVVASDGAVNGTQTLNVRELAASEYLTGARLYGKNGKLTSASTLKELGITSEASFKIKATANGEEKTITVNGDTTLRSFVSQLSSAGLNANFDEGQQRLYISAKSSGTENKFTFEAADADAVSAMMKMGLYTKEDADKVIEPVVPEWEKWRDYQGIAFSLESDGTVSSVIGAKDDAQKAEVTEYLEKKYADTLKAFEDSQNKIIDEMEARFAETDGSIDVAVANWKDYQAKMKAAEEAQQAHDEIKKKVDAGEEGVSVDDLQQAALALDTAKKAAEQAATTYTNSVSPGGKALMSNSEMQQYIAAKANLAEDYEKNKVDIALKVSDGFFGKVENATTALEEYNKPADKKSYGNRIEAQDCVITLNGVEYTGSSNSITVNGLTISAKSKMAEGETVSLVTDNDYQKVYDTIKNFISEYNKLINEMDSLYNAESSKGYDPLTSEEKEAMTDSDIEKWETKIKDSLLRRDNTLDEISQVMKTAMSRVYTVNGKKYSLSSFGINTLGYFNAATNEKNAYHIDGDADDASTSGNKDRLMSMIASEPETVMGFFTQLAQGLYEDMGKRMKSTSLRSIYNVYNDKQMASDLKDYDDDIKYWENYLKEVEDKYYKQFSAMETALAKLQSSSSALAGLMGN